jgi:hypothetical protein
MATFQCLRTLVTKLNRPENRLFSANVTMPLRELEHQFEVRASELREEYIAGVLEIQTAEVAE